MGMHRVYNAMKGKVGEAECFGDVQGEKIARNEVALKCHTKV
jgi:hypothetical protein